MTNTAEAGKITMRIPFLNWNSKFVLQQAIIPCQNCMTQIVGGYAKNTSNTLDG